MNAYDTLAGGKTIAKTAKALKENGINTIVVENGTDAKRTVLDMLPDNAEVMTMTSATSDSIGLSEAILESPKHVSVRKQIMSLDPEKERKEMKKLGSVHDFVIGSVHAITEAGQVVIASNTGSQLPAYVYGANHVIWIVGTQKIVKNLDSAFKRIYDYILPLESERVKKAYGMPRSNVSKILIVNKEVVPGRITVVFVEEKLGF